MEEIKVKCPNCNAPLKVKFTRNEAVQQIRFKCSECDAPLRVEFSSQQKPLEAHTVLVPPQPNPAPDGATILGGVPSGATILGVPQQAPSKSSMLVFKGNDYPLVEGQNIIGRKAKSSTASVQIETTDRYMSRQHCRITVKTLPDGTKKAILSNYQNKNTTKVDGQEIANGDEIRLTDGDCITMGHTTLTFKLS